MGKTALAVCSLVAAGCGRFGLDTTSRVDGAPDVATPDAAPLCADVAAAIAFPGTGTVVTSVHVANVQEALLGISADAPHCRRSRAPRRA